MENSSFAKLPAELRNYISVLALSHEGTIVVEAILPNNDPDNDYEWVMHRKRPLALTQTCKTMRADTLQLFYASNSFSLTCHRHSRDAYSFNNSLYAPLAVQKFVQRYGANVALAHQIIIDTGTLEVRDYPLTDTSVRQLKQWMQRGPLKLNLLVKMTLDCTERVKCNVNMLDLDRSLEIIARDFDESIKMPYSERRDTLFAIKSLLKDTSTALGTPSRESVTPGGASDSAGGNVGREMECEVDAVAHDLRSLSLKS